MSGDAGDGTSLIKDDEHYIVYSSLYCSVYDSGLRASQLRGDMKMNTMKMPGFTAEFSVYRTSRHYQMTAGFDMNGRVVWPQACDPDCAGECSSGCDDLTGRQRLQCIIGCMRGCGCGPQPSPGPGTPPEVCTVRNDRTCLPWPLDSICWGSCERTCCRESGDQRLCGISPC